MIVKALLPLIAVIKFKCDGHHGELFGKDIATVYKACKQELSPVPPAATPAEKVR